jgi:hypothetical protein
MLGKPHDSEIVLAERIAFGNPMPTLPPDKAASSRTLIRSSLKYGSRSLRTLDVTP